MKPRTIATRLIQEHDGRLAPLSPLASPIFQSSTYTYPDLFSGKVDYDTLKYLRLNNSPNHETLAQKIAMIEGTEAGLVTGSGMAAISAALLSFLKSGDHFLAQDCLYGGTLSFIFEDLKHLGITCEFFRLEDLAHLESKIRPETRLIYIESVTNPLLQIIDMHQVVALAKKHQLLTLIDNTFCSPMNFRPAELGIDVVLHSATKYLNGHSDICAGAVAGRVQDIDRIKHKLNHLGGCLDPHACFLLLRSLKTLDLRMKAHNTNGQKIAEFLTTHEKVEQVFYPGLESHPQHAYAKKYFEGFGGVVTLKLKGGAKAAQVLCESTQIFQHAPSLGGIESLITIPWLTTHAGVPESERTRIGLSPAIIRLAVGIEAAEDLIEDLTMALKHS